MAEYQIVYWHEFPSMVAARGDGAARREKSSAQLSPRFQEAIDVAAMRRGLTGTDAYLEGWTRSEWQARPGTPDAVASTVASEIEAEYSDERLQSLILGV
jgi:hypothetical protein